MTISDIQSARDPGASAGTKNGADTQQAARNREIIRTIREINEGGGVGPSSELRFSIDQESGQPLIRIVDRVTDEVITQLPPEALLRTAEVLKGLKPGDRIA